MQYLTVLMVISLVGSNLGSVIIKNPKVTNMDEGLVELKPNGSLILRISNSHKNSSDIWQEAIIIKTILKVLRLMPLQAKITVKDLNQKIYGDGVEHKLPPFLERVIQRIQTYFSIYKYTDASQPVWENKRSTTTTTAKPLSATSMTAALNETLTLGENEIDVNFSSGSSLSNSGFNKNNKTLLNVYQTQTNSSTIETATTTIQPLGSAEEDEENEFIEIKN